ncbi:hypothetical protein D3C81_1259140 [compost metagenome]
MAVGAVGQRDAQCLRRRHAAADAVDHFHRHAVRAQEGGLFAAAAEQQRIAALDARHGAPGQRMLQRQLLDARLGDRAAAAALADPLDMRAGPGIAGHLRRDQVIDQPYVGGRERAHRAHRDQVGAAGAGADQPDLAGLEGRVHA